MINSMLNAGHQSSSKNFQVVRADEIIYRVVESHNVSIAEECVYAPRQARYEPIPTALAPQIKTYISRRYPSGLFAHQAKAISLGLEGKSICVCTPTASGKTLIFSAIVSSKLLSDRGATALVLYPAKALISDQLSKWQETLNGTDITPVLIHGGVPIDQRLNLIKTSRVVLMTPDVLHAWLMANLVQPEIESFVTALETVVLDEAHIYDSVFGTNTAYLLRRLRAVSGFNQILASTATIGEPASLMERLTGIRPSVIGASDDGASAPEKKMMVCRVGKSEFKKLVVSLAVALAKDQAGRFLIFVDSRQGVEELTGQILNSMNKKSEEASANLDGSELQTEDATPLHQGDNSIVQRVLPYRAGYEENDRQSIQRALTTGTLAGVVSTSALELGIDIGEIETVINLGVPPTIKSFWQRAGRAGRLRRGVILLLDVDGRIENMGLKQYLSREPEPGWIYLDNEYLQFSNALCAAEEYTQSSVLYSNRPFNTLPEKFLAFLENEITPSHSIPSELYSLKRQAVSGPHRAFPLRSGIEKSYKVLLANDPNLQLGTLTYGQLMREAYPGAIYRYMAKPYRIVEIRHLDGQIRTTHCRGPMRTEPSMQIKVFPQFSGDYFSLIKGENSFICDARLQVSERVTGFTERIGNSSNVIEYGPSSPYSQRPLMRFIETTGVCFYFAQNNLQPEVIGKYLANALSAICGVHIRDIGYGAFFSTMSPLGSGECRGFAVFDACFGSLRLTKQLIERFDEIIVEATRLAGEDGATNVLAALEFIDEARKTMSQSRGDNETTSVFLTAAEGDWIQIIANNQPAILHDGAAHNSEEVHVIRMVYTPQGMRYELKSPKHDANWFVADNMVLPINGVTQLVHYNLMTAETKELI